MEQCIELMHVKVLYPEREDTHKAVLVLKLRLIMLAVSQPCMLRIVSLPVVHKTMDK